METSTQASVAPLESPGDRHAEGTQLGRLMAEVLGRPRGNRRDVAEALNQALGELKPGLDQREARALLVLLDEKELDDTVDTHGQQVREVAVQALLRVGYPWALQIDPEDLSWFREGARRGQSRLAGPPQVRWWAWATAAGVLALGAAGAWTIWGDDLKSALDLEGALPAGQLAAQSVAPPPLQGLEALPRRADGPDGSGGSGWVNVVSQRVGPPGFSWSELQPRGAPPTFTQLRAEIYHLLDGARVGSWAFNELASPAYRPSGLQDESVRQYRLPSGAAYRPGESYLIVVRGQRDGAPFAVRSEAFIPFVFGP